MNRVFKIVVSIFALLWMLKEVALPVTVAAVYSKQFMRQTMKCDAAMEADWYNRQTLPEHSKSDIVQLYDCHEYDKTRKTLLMAGLPEVYLSWLGLKALEIYQRPADEFAEQHRFVER